MSVQVEPEYAKETIVTVLNMIDTINQYSVQVVSADFVNDEYTE